MTPDLLNFKKGWMSKLDDTGEWKKHWFVLTDAGLKYYRDSVAEEKDELDGEIDLRSCIKVSEFNVEKNYGFQIQTVGDVFTLSAMTAGIRRNWIEVLRKNIRPSSSPDLTQLPDSSADKDASQHRPAQRLASQSEPSPAPSPAPRKFDYVELSPVATPAPSAPADQREAGEGQVREHGQAPDERVRAGQRTWTRTPEQKRLEQDIEKKWEEFERLPLKMTTSLPALGAWPALQREQVAPLRKLQQEKCVSCGVPCVCAGGGVSVCGCCSASLEQMERAHRQALDELQRRHERQTSELRRDRERVLNEEVQATAHAMEALSKAHKAELEREVQRARTLTAQTAGTHSLTDQHQHELLSLKRELDGLSDQYSQKCLELKREQQQNREKEHHISLKAEEVEQLSREKQDLQSRLTEEIRRVRSFITGQKPEVSADGDKERPACELEVLLRVKKNEVDYLHREVMCLRNEVHFLSTEKQGVCERYNEVCEELKVMKDRSDREVQTLQEHLKLAVAALQEQQILHNSI
ncbi:TRIO and F-actin binding protein b [Trichomycterus rosablanca]|uniref:TRIO and F-actin binding protein b n=1 Tax=Trichomycterus rosablanca TaxID=2290929 RepID=UPI002F35AEDB